MKVAQMGLFRRWRYPSMVWVYKAENRRGEAGEGGGWGKEGNI